MASNVYHAFADGSVDLRSDPLSEMVALRGGPALLNKVIEGLGATGWTVVNRSDRGMPKWLTIERGPETRRLAIYIWLVNFGGRSKRPHERRIEIADSVRGRLLVGQDHDTLLLGCYQHEEHGILCAWDVERHANPSRSGSCWVDVHSIARAMRDGFDHYRTDADEWVAVFQPQLIEVYWKYHRAFHSGGFVSSEPQVAVQAS